MSQPNNATDRKNEQTMNLSNAGNWILWQMEVNFIEWIIEKSSKLHISYSIDSSRMKIARSGKTHKFLIDNLTFILNRYSSRFRLYSMLPFSPSKFLVQTVFERWSEKSRLSVFHFWLPLEYCIHFTSRDCVAQMLYGRSQCLFFVIESNFREDLKRAVVTNAIC